VLRPVYNVEAVARQLDPGDRHESAVCQLRSHQDVAADCDALACYGGFNGVQLFAKAEAGKRRSIWHGSMAPTGHTLPLLPSRRVGIGRWPLGFDQRKLAQLSWTERSPQIATSLGLATA